jgi:hypothetical protein
LSLVCVNQINRAFDFLYGRVAGDQTPDDYIFTFVRFYNDVLDCRFRIRFRAAGVITIAPVKSADSTLPKRFGLFVFPLFIGNSFSPYNKG